MVPAYQDNVWVLQLTRSLPSLLIALLDQKEGISLERLQLIGCEITRAETTQKNEENPQWHTISLTRAHEGKDHFLYLSGTLIGTVALDIRLSFFIRGQKKFFRPNLSMPEQICFSSWCAIDQDWITQSLKTLSQENTIFTSRDLAELNGRADIQLPSHLFLTILLNEAMKTLSHEGKPRHHFKITFFQAVATTQALLKAVILQNEHGSLWVMQAGMIVAQVTVL